MATATYAEMGVLRAAAPGGCALPWVCEGVGDGGGGMVMKALGMQM
jgi:hypothetical protein